MKRKVFDLSGWTRADSHVQTVTHLPGYVIVDFRAGPVSRPLDLFSFGRVFRLLDTGYRWLRVHPHGAGEGVMGHALTVQLNAQGVPIQLYIDIHGGEGVTASGFPWHDDLYLDVLCQVESLSWKVVGVEYIDQDELQEAFENGLVGAGQVAASYAEADRVRASLLAGTFSPLLVARTYLAGPGRLEP
ncbi:DUF402 domain-containing protein [Deinococcus radiomollis]|uniref:DUF402 domain-containing protein n=1 Tax=Deinococcus radiomollis TaxID=468916 RepID=UPI0038927E5E